MEPVSAQEIDEYLDALEEPKRTTLARLRQAILDVLPEVSRPAPDPMRPLPFEATAPGGRWAARLRTSTIAGGDGRGGSPRVDMVRRGPPRVEVVSLSDPGRPRSS